MYTTVQQYVSQYRNINFCTGIHIVVLLYTYKFQYKNKTFGTEKYFLTNLEKIGRCFIYDYYYVPKYMLIIVYLNKPYIFHYYKLSQLYSTKHHLTPLYHIIHSYTSPHVHVPYHAPLYLTIYLFTSPYTHVSTHV